MNLKSQIGQTISTKLLLFVYFIIYHPPLKFTSQPNCANVSDVYHQQRHVLIDRENMCPTDETTLVDAELNVLNSKNLGLI